MNIGPFIRTSDHDDILESLFNLIAYATRNNIKFTSITIPSVIYDLIGEQFTQGKKKLMYQNQYGTTIVVRGK